MKYEKFFEEQLESLFGGNILLVGCMLIITAILLYLADKAKNTNKDQVIFFYHKKINITKIHRIINKNFYH